MNDKLNVSSLNKIDMDSKTEILEKLQRKIDRSSIKWGGRGIAKEIKYGFQKIAHFFKTFKWESREQRVLSQIHKDFKILDSNLDHMNNRPKFTARSLADYKKFTKHANKQLEIMKNICYLVETHPNKTNEKHLESIKKDIDLTKNKIEFNLLDTELRRIIETSQDPKQLENIQKRLNDFSSEAKKNGNLYDYVDLIEINHKIINMQLGINQTREDLKNADSEKIDVHMKEMISASKQKIDKEIIKKGFKTNNQKEVLVQFGLQINQLRNQVLKRKYELLNERLNDTPWKRTDKDIDNLKNIKLEFEEIKKIIIDLKQYGNKSLLQKISHGIEKCDSKIESIKKSQEANRKKIEYQTKLAENYGDQILEIEGQLNKPNSIEVLKIIKNQFLILRYLVEELSELDNTSMLKKIDDRLQTCESTIHEAVTHELSILKNEFKNNQTYQNYLNIRDDLNILKESSKDIKEEKIHEKINKLLNKCNNEILEIEKHRDLIAEKLLHVEKLEAILIKITKKKGYTSDVLKIETGLTEISNSVKYYPDNENWSNELNQFKTKINELLEMCKQSKKEYNEGFINSIM